MTYRPSYDEDNIDGHAEQARHFNIDPRYTFHVEATGGGMQAHAEPWSCIDDRTYDGAPDASNMIGWGATKEEALADLVRLFNERADYQEEQAMAEAERLNDEEGRNV